MASGIISMKEMYTITPADKPREKVKKVVLVFLANTPSNPPMPVLSPAAADISSASHTFLSI